MAGCSKLSHFHQIFWAKFCSVIHTRNKITLISIIVRIKWVVSKCCSTVASHLLCILISVVPQQLLNKFVSWCWTWRQSTVMHKHHNHTAQYFQFGAVKLRGRGGQQTRQQQLTYLWLQYQYWLVKTMVHAEIHSFKNLYKQKLARRSSWELAMKLWTELSHFHINLIISSKKAICLISSTA